MTTVHSSTMLRVTGWGCAALGLLLGAGRRGQRQEAPDAVQDGERAIDQFHRHAAVGHVGVAGGEGMPGASVLQVQPSGHALGGFGEDFTPLAPRPGRPSRPAGC